MNKKTAYFILLLLSLPFSEVYAADKETLDRKIKSINPNMEVTDVRESPIEGIAEVEINGKEYLYATHDSQYIFTGNLVRLEGDSFTNITERRIESLRKSRISEIDIDTAITFKADDEKDEIYVFTDVTCGYCVKFHEHIGEINSHGITVHYFAFPRSGMSSPAADMMRKVWCSPDQRAALTEAKIEKKVTQSPLPCNSPIASHYTLAYQFGVSGTPAIYDKNGRHLGGYLTAQEIENALSK